MSQEGCEECSKRLRGTHWVVRWEVVRIRRGILAFLHYFGEFE